MFSESAISHRLVEAYRATHYRVDAATPFVLRVGLQSPELAKLYPTHHCDCAAFITACNPWGELLNASHNLRRTKQLSQELLPRSASILPGVGIDPNGEWQSEISFLVLGMERESSIALAKAYDQNALVYAGSDATPQLTLLR